LAVLVTQLLILLKKTFFSINKFIPGFPAYKASTLFLQTWFAALGHLKIPVLKTLYIFYDSNEEKKKNV
jgi:hypothetical protein